MKRTRKPTHPGEAFKSLVIEPLGLTVTETAEKLKVSRNSLSRVINGKASLSPVMAKRFARFTNTSIESWYNMQVNLDIWEIKNDC